MKNLTKISIVALAMAVTACSSGGGGSKNTVPKPKVEQKQDQKQQIPKSDTNETKQDVPKPEVNKPKQNTPQLEGNGLLQGVPKPETNESKQRAPEPKINEPKQNVPEPKINEPKQDVPKSKKSEPDLPKTLEPRSPKLAQGGTYFVTLDTKNPGATLKTDFQSSSIDSQDVGILMVDGKQINVVAGKLTDDYVFYYKNEDFVSNSQLLPNTKFGLVQVEDSRWAAFVQGYSTSIANMPKQGNAQYIGSFLYISDGLQIGNKAVIDVDFGAKKLTGTLSLSGARKTENDVTFSADIKSNYFVGITGSARTGGLFYGENADELGGTYENRQKNEIAVFGAKKASNK
ncbi:transferrin-binding protein-like solute binding protein [Actinobacillus equuli]|uniref:transferrin-binding protein-like solute binding protein n=1 Tax=Actinobacillus equuli TaxID=718 RepID=UPI0024182D12|nr:transferrin-binding protein-like solute binding protein [Actinobacillus equuli]MDG4952361.1 transferrin-binding protein-like solute binding protein [Actinobacillus equuli subsp. equuli]